MSRCTLACVLFCSLALLWPCRGSLAGGGDGEAMVEGMVFSRYGPLAGAEVAAYRDFADLAGGQPLAVSRPGDKPGEYRLLLPPGRYLLAARGSIDDTPYSGYHGRNPLVIEAGYRWLPFFVVAEHPVRRQPGFQGISGQVRYKDAPLTRGTVSVYSADSDSFRGMGLFSNSLDEEGRFFFDLEPGRYVVIARHRRQGTEMGPLHRGDLFCFATANPVTVLPGQESEVVVPCYPRDDLADFLIDPHRDPRGRKEPQRRHASFWHETPVEDTALPAAATAPLTLRGTVRDLEGRPQAGLYVSAYPATDFPLFQMFVLRFLTPYLVQTGEDGSFQLRLPPGTYYLQARQLLGKAPEGGELYGLYEGNANHTVTVTPGPAPPPVTITVGAIMP